MPLQAVRAFAPATVANVGPGFDVCGFALEGPGDIVEVRRSARPGVRVVGITGDGGKLPRDVRRNVAAAVAAKMLHAAGARFGFDLVIEKGLPLGSGMGSSSASSVAAAVAADALLGSRFGASELLEFARFGEKVACGTAHADNVAPCLLGGFTIVRDGTTLGVARMAVPRPWRAVVAHPHLSLPTRRARAALPKQVPLSRMTANVGAAAAMVAALASADLAAFGAALMGDTVVEPARKALIPGYEEVVRAALRHGAAGACISGAGPSMLALTDSASRAKVIAEGMVGAWRRSGIAADTHIGRMGGPGARVLSRR